MGRSKFDFYSHIKIIHICFKTLSLNITCPNSKSNFKIAGYYVSVLLLLLGYMDLLCKGEKNVNKMLLLSNDFIFFTKNKACSLQYEK